MFNLNKGLALVSELLTVTTRLTTEAKEISHSRICLSLCISHSELI